MNKLIDLSTQYFISSFVIICRPSVCPSTPLKDFPFEAPGPIFFKMHAEPSVEDVLKIYTNGHSPPIEIASLLVWRKIMLLQNYESFEAKSWYTASGILVYSIKSTKFVQSYPRLTADLFQPGQNCVSVYLYGKIIEKTVSQNVLKKGKRKVQGVPQSQTEPNPRPQEEEETDKSKQAQTEQTYEKH